MYSNNWLRLIVVVVALVVGSIVIRNQQTQAPPETPAPLPPPVAVVEEPRKVWPPTGDTVELASDLTARNYYVVFDGSGSMTEAACEGSGDKITQAKAALQSFAAAIPPAANLGLTVFDAGGIAERLPLGTDNREAFIQHVMAVSPDGGTPLRKALETGERKLGEQARRQLGYGEYHLVVVTDGEASTGQDPRSAVKEILGHTPIVIHTIGFCIGSDHSLNQPGQTVYKSANNPDELKRGLEEVLAEATDFPTTSFTP